MGHRTQKPPTFLPIHVEEPLEKGLGDIRNLQVTAAARSPEMALESSGKGRELVTVSVATPPHSSYEGDFWLPLVLAHGSPIFHSSCEGPTQLGSDLQMARSAEPNLPSS